MRLPWGKVVVLLNQGGRRFSSPFYYAASDGPVGITAADFNGDGKPDLAVSCHLSGDLVVLLNRGEAPFSRRSATAGSITPVPSSARTSTAMAPSTSPRRA